MKIYIISNTQFGYKGIIKNQLDYFNNKIIPYLVDNSKNGDIFIHGGNIFNNRKNVSMDVIHDVMEIFEKISKILPIYIIKSLNDDLASLILKRINNVKIIENKEIINNVTLISYNNEFDDISNDIVIFNHNYLNNPDTYKEILKNNKINICTNNDDYLLLDDNIINIGSPYKLNKDQKNEKGFLVIDSDKKKHKFINNDYSPNFININIENEEDLNNFQIDKKDFIYLNVNELLIEKKENLNKLNILINKYDFKNVIYYNNNKKEKININNESFDIKSIINKYLKDNNLDLYKELDIIYKIYSEKN
jgi:hypothetical protein